MPLRLHVVLVLSTVFGMSACSPAPMPVSRSQHDPSNPDAPEGVAPTAAELTPGAPPSAPASSHDHGGHAHDVAPSDAGAGYVCPMHAEVTSPTPGACPKCNMKLVPKK